MGMYNKEVITDFGLACEPGSSMTKQAFKDDCDINKILAKVQKTGMLEHLAQGTPFYGDVTDIVEYKEALGIINKANSLFMEFTPEIREKFDNDPQKMINFLNDEANYDEAVKLGMVIDKRVAKESVSEVKATEESNGKP